MPPTLILTIGLAIAILGIVVGVWLLARCIEQLIENAKGLPAGPPFAEAFAKGDRVVLVVSDGAGVMRVEVSREAATHLLDRLDQILSPAFDAVDSRRS